MPRKEFTKQVNGPPALDEHTTQEQNTQEYRYSLQVILNAMYWREHELISRMRGNALRAEIEAAKWQEWLHVEIWPLSHLYLMPASQYDYVAHMESLDRKDARRKAYDVEKRSCVFYK